MTASRPVMKPPAREGFGGLLRVLQIALHHRCRRIKFADGLARGGHRLKRLRI